MKHADSLARLAAWADLCRGILPPIAFAFGPTLDDAERHGHAAVRAIRKALLNQDATDIRLGFVDPGWGPVARHEARLAFRAALSAVGLRTL